MAYVYNQASRKMWLTVKYGILGSNNKNDNIYKSEPQRNQMIIHDDKEKIYVRSRRFGDIMGFFK